MPNDEVAELPTDEALAETAKGHFTSDESLDEEASEIDAMARAAGLPTGDASVTTPAEAVEKRDQHRFELDPDSAADRDERGQ
jgi:Family of unknown function (DUF6335)